MRIVNINKSLQIALPIGELRLEVRWLGWCPGRELNPHVPFGTRDFKSRASASFATRADISADVSTAVWKGLPADEDRRNGIDSYVSSADV